MVSLRAERFVLTTIRSPFVEPSSYCSGEARRVKLSNVDSLGMAQFGAGSELAAQCPRAPSPDGWKPWTDAEGPIPDALAHRAEAMAGDASVPLGATESYPLPGVTTLIRVEPRTWSRDAQGALVQGCFRAGGVYLPLDAVVAPSGGDSLSKTISVLTVVSLAVGTAATLAAWGKS